MYPGFMDGYTEIAAVESGMVESISEHVDVEETSFELPFCGTSRNGTCR